MNHKFYMDGHYIVLDVNSGAVHTVDELVYLVLDYYETKTPDEIMELLPQFEQADILEAIEEIKTLTEQELLFSNDQYTQSITQTKQPVVKALCLHIAHDCNLQCRYCFAEEGEYGGKRSLMSLETGKKAIDFIIHNSGNRRNLEVDFFGGEPLMNFEVIKQLVSYAREQEPLYNKNFRFTLTTNGVLLTDEVQQYVNENMSNVVLSIDGRKEVNDTMRKTRSGAGSYDLIVPKFLKMAESRGQKNYYVRGTYTRDNLDFSEDVLHLADLGFQQISVEPVVADSSCAYAIQPEDVQGLCDEYEKLASAMLKREDKPFQFFHFMIDLTGGPCVVKRVSGCGAGCEYLAVTPEGDLYPCHQFVGIDRFKMGTLNTGIENETLRLEFARCNVFAKEECNACFAKFYCSGGCAANAYQTHGDILKPYEVGCDLQRKRVECALMMEVAKTVKK